MQVSLYLRTKQKLFAIVLLQRHEALPLLMGATSCRVQGADRQAGLGKARAHSKAHGRRHTV